MLTKVKYTIADGSKKGIQAKSLFPLYLYHRIVVYKVLGVVRKLLRRELYPNMLYTKKAQSVGKSFIHSLLLSGNIC